MGGGKGVRLLFFFFSPLFWVIAWLGGVVEGKDWRGLFLALG